MSRKRKLLRLSPLPWSSSFPAACASLRSKKRATDSIHGPRASVFSLIHTRHLTYCDKHPGGDNWKRMEPAGKYSDQLENCLSSASKFTTPPFLSNRPLLLFILSTTSFFLAVSRDDPRATGCCYFMQSSRTTRKEMKPWNCGYDVTGKLRIDLRTPLSGWMLFPRLTAMNQEFAQTFANLLF